MFENKTEATPVVKKMLLKKLTSWENKEVKNENEAFTYFHKDTEYLLKMLWQARLDKMNEDDRALNVWISENYVPKEYGFDSKKIREPQLSNLELGQDELVKYVLKEVWKDYLNSDLENVSKPPKEKVGFFKKIFK